ncbi:MAG: hypothetical protein Q7J30_01210, partial [Candidatus Azambacteria bacterium]|nr:hypothetical protein [Candidatus Azambacteria bacterium]
MAIAEKLEQKRGALKEKLTKKSQETENTEGASIDSMEWLLLFLAAGYIDILFILLAIIGFLPFVGQIIYAIADPV